MRLCPHCHLWILGGNWDRVRGRCRTKGAVSLNAPSDRFCVKCGLTKPSADFRSKGAWCGPCRDSYNEARARKIPCRQCGSRTGRSVTGASASELCHECRHAARRRARRPPRRTGRTWAKDGYLFAYVPGRGRIPAHRLVMELHLGRALLKSESVHHKNGDRADNRLTNLEMWSRSQPAGQRVEDKVEWAIELLHLYRPELLADLVRRVA